MVVVWFWLPLVVLVIVFGFGVDLWLLLFTWCLAVVGFVFAGGFVWLFVGSAVWIWMFALGVFLVEWFGVIGY